MILKPIFYSATMSENRFYPLSAITTRLQQILAPHLSKRFWVKAEISSGRERGHVVPAHAFGKTFPEWRNGHSDCKTRKGKSFKGRNFARKMASPFRYMESDMYNLVPAIGEINGLRPNYSFAIVPGEKRIFGKCDMEIEGRKAEPPPDKRGNIARTYFYMNWAYPGHGVISKKNQKLFKAWDKVRWTRLTLGNVRDVRELRGFRGMKIPL